MRCGQNDALVKLEDEAAARHGSVWLPMLRKLALTATMGAGLALPGGTLADQASYPRPRYLGANVLYIGGGLGGRGYLMCRLTPQCCWSFDAWTGSMCTSCRNIVVCY